MNIVAIINQKGGVGKTSLAINIAGEIGSNPKARVVVIDLDPQGSATQWLNQSKEQLPFAVQGFDAENNSPAEFKVLLSELGARFNIALVDTPPGLSDPAGIAALMADFVLIPVTPSPLDIWAAKDAVKLVRDARVHRDGVKPHAALVPYKLRTGTVLSRQLPDTLKALGEPVAPAAADRVAVAEAAIAGKPVGMYAPNSPAHTEIIQIATYALGRIK